MTARYDQEQQKARDDLRKIMRRFREGVKDVDPRELDDAIAEAVQAAKLETAAKLAKRQSKK